MNAADTRTRNHYIIDRLIPPVDPEDIRHNSAVKAALLHMIDWQWFGWLWKECHMDQEWWCRFGWSMVYDESDITHEKHQELVSDLEWFIDPDLFAYAVYKFFKENG